MSEKEKRKVNPRRRTLIRLLIGIAIIAALVSMGIYALRPTGAQIVFIAPDDNGVDNIWIADLNDPEHPRQLTFLEQGTYFRLRGQFGGFQVAETDNTLIFGLYSSGDDYPNTIWELNLRTGQSEYVMTCNEACSDLVLHPDGEWITYTEFVEGENYSDMFNVHVYNLKTSESYIVYEYMPEYRDHFFQPVPRWVGSTDLPLFQSDFRDNYDYILYSLSENRITRTFSLGSRSLILYSAPRFSGDGSLLVFRTYDNCTECFSFNYFDDQLSPILEFEIPSRYISVADWHPDNRRVLLNESNGAAISLYDIFALTSETLVWSLHPTERYESISLNHNGSQILYLKVHDNDEANVSQIMIYDMETREEIALPLFGHSPQWINGGR